MTHYDVLIIGSGAAGLGLALSLADDARIALLSKDRLVAGSSQYAQGGIAAVMSQDDSIASHVDDTLIAGDGLCHREVVEFTAQHAKAAITWLIEQGVQFTTHKDPSHYHLTQEGGHSHRRILHAADKTGAVVTKTLAEQVLQHDNIDCFVEHTVVDLLTEEGTCFGAIAIDNQQATTKTLHAKTTVLATGGASSVYLHTSNPDQATGDGIVMAYRAGCRVANLEFNQFHPTCLFHKEANSFLITEVIRGEGGLLKLPNGDRFMDHYDPRAELASRDIVARAIHSEMQKHVLSHVYLDISHKHADDIKMRFPTIYAKCLSLDIDITQQPIPVVPAAHYTCGGVMTDLHGQTDVTHLYAIGEVACTGLHGANRMASNSLLECLVFAMSASQHIQHALQTQSFSHSLSPDTRTVDGAAEETLSDLSMQLKETLWNFVGIVRCTAGLRQAKEKIAALKETLDAQPQFNKAFIELSNLVEVSQLIIESALLRQESRGLHFNTDYPEKLSTAKDTILTHKQPNTQLT